MNTKKCNKCREVKPLAEFSKNKTRKDGYQPQCKGCTKHYQEKNKVVLAEKAKRYREENKPARAERNKRYREENSVAISEQRKRYREENKPALAEKAKRYREENKPAIEEYQNQWHKERRATDPLFRLTDNIRSLIGSSLRNGGFSKKSKTASILGCSFEEFHRHIESQFKDGMSWQRMGEIHIDHRLPVSAATTEAELLALNHYSNLQPMWATDNLAKSDSYCTKDLAAYFKKHLPT